MDLKDFEPSEEIVVELTYKGEALINPDETPMTITLWAPHSKGYKEIIYSNIDEAIKKADGNPKYRPTAKEANERQLETLAKATKDWNITLDGKCPKITVGSVKEIYEKYPFIRKLVDSALEDSEDFT